MRRFVQRWSSDPAPNRAWRSGGELSVPGEKEEENEEKILSGNLHGFSSHRVPEKV